MGNLTRKQRIFIERYLECWNATKAATEAGYGQPHSAGARMLQRADVNAAIEARMKEAALEADEVLKRLRDQATLNPSEFYQIETDPDGNTSIDINWDEFRRRGHLVKALKFTRTGKPVLEFYDSQAALGMIGKAMGMFVDRTDVTQHVDEVQVTVYIPDNGRQLDQQDGADGGN